MKLESNKPYTNRQWLIFQYLELKKSTCKIAQDIECSTLTVLNWLRKFDLPVRSKSEALGLNRPHVFLSKQLLEVLNGLLLGDGHLNHQNKWTSNYQHSTKHKVVLEWLADLLKAFGIGQTGKIYRYEKRTSFPGNKICRTVSFFYASQHYAELKELQSKWYRPATEEEREKGRKFFKIVPPDLVLTPLTCLHWYIGDGHLEKKHKGVYLCTQGFSENEVDFLISLLKKLGIKATRHKNKDIYLSVKSVLAFLNYIGHCPKKIESVYKYKWAIK